MAIKSLVNNTSSMGVFSLIGNRHFWKLTTKQGIFIANLSSAKKLLVQHCFWVSPIFYTLQVEECCAINERKGFEFLSKFLCGYHKNEDLCCMHYAFLLVFVGLHLLLVGHVVICCQR
jgi:hypothetical protein